MPVYVDKAAHPFRGMVMCHMLADSLEELHAMAGQLGMQRAWFQPRSTPHYDLPQDVRERALLAGCIEIDRARTVQLIRHWRSLRLAQC